MAAWIVREWTDGVTPSGRPKRHRKKVAFGLKGVEPSDTFVVEWLEPKSGARRQKKIPGTGRPAKRLADNKAKDVNSKLTLGVYVESNRTTWTTAREKYEELELPKKRSEETRRSIRDTLTCFEELTTPNRLAEIDIETIDTFIAKRLDQDGRGGEKLSAATVNKDLRNLRLFFRKLAEWKLVDGAPRIVMLDEIENEKPSYTEAEFTAMHAACDAATMPYPWELKKFSATLWWRTFLCLLWETGCRRKEALLIEWSDVDMKNRCLRVRAVTRKNRRPKEYSFGDMTADHLQYLARLGTEGRVFPWDHDPTQLSRQLAQIQKKAGIDSKRANLKFHAFRRTVGNAIAERFGLDAAQRKLGHSSPQTTARHYAQAAMRRLGKESRMPVVPGIRPTGDVVGDEVQNEITEAQVIWA